MIFLKFSIRFNACVGVEEIVHKLALFLLFLRLFLGKIVADLADFVFDLKELLFQERDGFSLILEDFDKSLLDFSFF